MITTEIRNVLEHEVFGVCADFRECPPEYASYRASMEDVRSHQPQGWNVVDPPTEIGKQMYSRIHLLLRRKFSDGLELHCSLGSSFDYWHGIDGFILTTGKGCVAIATFDLTMNHSAEKVRNQKADVRITGIDIRSKSSFSRVCYVLSVLLKDRVCELRELDERMRKFKLAQLQQLQALA